MCVCILYIYTHITVYDILYVGGYCDVPGARRVPNAIRMDPTCHVLRITSYTLLWLGVTFHPSKG